MVLRLDARMLDHGPGVGLQAGHGAANVAVDFDDFLDRGGFEERTGYALFYADYHAIAGSYLGGVGQLGSFLRGWGGGDYSDGGGAEFDCLKRVFDLEETAFGGEGTGRGLVFEVEKWMDRLIDGDGLRT